MRIYTSAFLFVIHSTASGTKRSLPDNSQGVELEKSAVARNVDFQHEYDSFRAATDPVLFDQVDKGELISAGETELLYSVGSREDVVLRLILDNGGEFGDIDLVHSGNMQFFYSQIAANLGLAPKILAKGVLGLGDFEKESDDDEAIYAATDAFRSAFPFTSHSNDLWDAIEGRYTIVPMLMESTGPCLDAIKLARGSIPLSEALAIGIQMMENLHMMHSVGNLLHGNLEPENICQSFTDPSKYLLTGFREALIIDPSSGSEVEFPGWNHQDGIQRCNRFSSVWELVPGHQYGPRDDVYRLLAIVMWLSQPEPMVTPARGASLDVWESWKKKFQFQNVPLNRNRIENDSKLSLIRSHQYLLRLVFRMPAGQQPPYSVLISGMRSIKSLLDHRAR